MTSADRETLKANNLTEDDMRTFHVPAKNRWHATWVCDQILLNRSYYHYIKDVYHTGEVVHLVFQGNDSGAYDALNLLFNNDPTN